MIPEARVTMIKKQTAGEYAADRGEAKAAAESFARYIVNNESVTLRVQGPVNFEEIQVPPEVVEVLMQALNAAAKGSKVTVIEQEEDLTTVQAARQLNVSRPFLIKLLEEGKIPFHKVGTHRRVKSGDLLAFQQAERERQDALLRFLTKEAQELGIYE